MIPQDILVAQRSGNMAGRSIAMEFDAASYAHLMSVLIDLYSDEILACIREYSTNAFDAHVQAGQTRPIEVTTPGPLSPYFIVQDWGIGMDAFDIESIYSQYGASTKRGTNDQVGMLGLGSKSALTYTNQFSVIGVKGGIMTTVLVSREQDGTGSMTVVDERPTSEPNGVKILIPSRNQHEFAGKAQKFFQFWKPGTVLLDGKEPVLPKHEVVASSVPGFGGEVLLVDNLGSDYVVMGNVAYPVKNNGLFGGARPYNNPFGVVAFVNIGSVNFTPNREALQYNDHTNKTLLAVRQAFNEGLVRSAQKAINDAPNHFAAAKVARQWRDRFYNNSVFQNLTYKGVEIPDTVKVDCISFDKAAGRYAVSTERAIHINRLAESLIVNGFNADSVSTRNKEKVREYLRQHNLTHRFIYFVEKPIDSIWAKDADTVEWVDIAAIRLGGPAKPRVKREQPYDVLNSDGYTEQTDTIDTSKTVLYFSPSEKFDNSVLTDVFRGATLVSLGKNRWEKFERDFPKAQHVSVYAKTVLEAAKAAITEDDKTFLRTEYYQRHAFDGLDVSKVDDPDVQDFVRVMTIGPKSPTIAALRKIERFTVPNLYIPAQTYGNVGRTPASKYPLISGNVGRHKDHVTLYMNAVYAAEKRNNNV